jgi:hypothetical protein
VWNDFFLTATGLSEQDAKKLTIFSIVQSDQLSSLYKMVARALCPPNADGAPPRVGSATSGPNGTTDSSSEEWQAITLKCVPFPRNNSNKNSKQKQGGTATHHPNPLYMTVSLMEDENRDHRCFHCILTDYPGTDGKMGSVTPELFAMLFAPSDKKASIEQGVDKGS